MRKNTIKVKHDTFKNMNINNNCETNIISNFLKSLFLIFLFLFGQLFMVLIISLFGIHYRNLSYNNKIILLLIGEFFVILIFFIVYKKTIVRDFNNFFNKNFFSNISTSISYWMIGVTIMVISNILISLITNGGVAVNEESVRELIDKVPLYMLFNVSIYAPFTEELVFRKSFNDFIDDKKTYILVSGLVFGGIHIISSLTSLAGLLYIIPYGALGIVFAKLYRETDNIFSTISIHSLHNFISFVIFMIGKYFV